MNSTENFKNIKKYNTIPIFADLTRLSYDDYRGVLGIAKNVRDIAENLIDDKPVDTFDILAPLSIEEITDMKYMTKYFMDQVLGGEVFLPIKLYNMNGEKIVKNYKGDFQYPQIEKIVSSEALKYMVNDMNLSGFPVRLVDFSIFFVIFDIKKTDGYIKDKDGWRIRNRDKYYPDLYLAK